MKIINHCDYHPNFSKKIPFGIFETTCANNKAVVFLIDQLDCSAFLNRELTSVIPTFIADGMIFHRCPAI